MLSRDILEEQELEYALSLIEDMERGSNDVELGQINQADQVASRPGDEKQQENQIGEDVGEDDEVERNQERNPSPRTLREMRRAYFEALQIRRSMASPVSPNAQPKPDSSSSLRMHTRSNPSGQTEHTRGRLRSGGSY